MSEIIDQFVLALREKAIPFGLELSETAVIDLVKYYGILQDWNSRLHLVAPCSPEEFAVRHALESILAMKHIPATADVVDIGSGGGLPIIPCMIVRPDIRATLFESSARKAVFLREAIRTVGISNRANVIASRFEDSEAAGASVVTCRALERFTELLTTIVEWSPANSRLIFFGGPSLQVEIEKGSLPFVATRIPESEQRFIFVIEKSEATYKS